MTQCCPTGLCQLLDYSTPLIEAAEGQPSHHAFVLLPLLVFMSLVNVIFQERPLGKFFISDTNYHLDSDELIRFF